MGKKRYIKPEVREDSKILTVYAWVTATSTSVALQNAATSTSFFAQSVTDFVSRTSVALQNQVVSTGVALQRWLTSFIRP